VPNTQRIVQVNLEEVSARNQNARSIIAGFAAALPTLAHFWTQLNAALADTPTLATELTTTRLQYANLAAAGLATLTSHNDGEPDPLSYLRDELHAQGHWGRA
jgi:hypothetical protein